MTSNNHHRQVSQNRESSLYKTQLSHDLAFEQLRDINDHRLKSVCEIYCEAFAREPYFETYAPEWVLNEVVLPHLNHCLIIGHKNDEVCTFVAWHPVLGDSISPESQKHIREFAEPPYDVNTSIYLSEFATRTSVIGQGLGTTVFIASLIAAKLKGYAHYTLRTAENGSHSMSIFKKYGAIKFGSAQEITQEETQVNQSQSLTRVYLWGKISEALEIANQKNPGLVKSLEATNPVSLSPLINLQQERMNMISTTETELFSDRVKMFHLWPGGNHTYICIAPTEERLDYIVSNRAILSKHRFMEQGGFVEKPTDAVVGRLQMAGGEFCGNATRSLGALIASDYFGKQEIAGNFDYSKIHEYDQNNIIFDVEISGTLEKPRLHVTKIKDDYNVSVVLNLIKNLDQVTNKVFQYSGKDIPVSVVKMDGITHVLVSEKELAFSPDPDEYRSRIDNLVNQLDLTNEAAVGLITYNKEGANVVINPVVWVAAVSTCFYETSCCSGSIALATSLWGTQDRDTMKVEIIQPSKTPLTIEITGSRITGEINKIDASGIVMVKGNLNDSGQLSKI